MASHTVALPPERFAQLKTLADAEHASLSDVVAGFLDEAIAAKRLPDALPGWHVCRLGDNVLLAHQESGFAKLLPVEGAKQVGAVLGRLSRPATGRSACLDLDNMIEMRRQGAGVIVRDANSLTTCSTAANVAADIGRRLLAAAA